MQLNTSHLSKKEDITFLKAYGPIFVSMLFTTFADIVDAIVLGQSLGTVGLSAISFSIPLYMVMNVLMHSIGLGGAVMYSSRKLRDEEDAGNILCSCLYVLIIVGFICSIIILTFTDSILSLFHVKYGTNLYKESLTYMRLIGIATPFIMFSYGSAYFLRANSFFKFAGNVFIAGNIVDILLNVILVSIFHMNALGAGIATLSGSVTVCIGEFICIVINRKIIPPKRHLNFVDVYRSFIHGFSKNSAFIFSFIFVSLMNIACMKLYHNSGVAAYEVIQNISYMLMYLYGAITQVMQPFISENYSKHNNRVTNKYAQIALRIGFVNGIIVSILFYLHPDWIARLFNVEQNMIVLESIRIYCTGILFMGFNTIISEIFIDMEIKTPSIIASVIKAIFSISPLLFILYNVDKAVLWWMFPIPEIVIFIALLIYTLVFMRKHNRYYTERKYL